MPMMTANSTMTRCLASMTLTTSWSLILVVLFRLLHSYWLGPCVPVLLASTTSERSQTRLISLLIDNLSAQLQAYMYINFQCRIQRTRYHIQPAEYLNSNLVEEYLNGRVIRKHASYISVANRYKNSGTARGPNLIERKAAERSAER